MTTQQVTPSKDEPIPGYPNLKRNGRPKGAQNKTTITFRETITNLLQDNSANVGVWLARVSEDDPAKALDLLAKLAEYAAPKLSKVEQTSEVNVTHGYAFAIERPTRPAIEGELVKPVEQLPKDAPEAATVTAIGEAAIRNPL
jgi:hypothetical protein